MKTLRVLTALTLGLGLAACAADEEAGSDREAGSGVMPDVVGLKLDVALSEIESAGFEDEVEVEGGGALGVVIKSRWEVCEQQPAAGDDFGEAPRLTVDRSCDDGGSDDATTTTSSEPEETTTSAPEAAYSGPEYEVVTVDPGAGMGVLDQYWVYTAELDYSTDGFKDQLKLLIADVVQFAGTDQVIVQVVTDREIAEAEAVSTREQFVDEHGEEYAVTVIPEKEKQGWVAWYAGGIDYETGELSDSDAAFSIDWFPASDSPTSERWRP
ncbi:MAG: PASTA domain-containing protein [Actinomycetota bacterium]